MVIEARVDELIEKGFVELYYLILLQAFEFSSNNP